MTRTEPRADWRKVCPDLQGIYDALCQLTCGNEVDEIMERIAHEFTRRASSDWEAEAHRWCDKAAEEVAVRMVCDMLDNKRALAEALLAEAKSALERIAFGGDSIGLRDIARSVLAKLRQREAKL